MNRGELYHTLTQFDKALTDHDKCIETRERLQVVGKLYNENDLATAYANKKATLDAMQR
jgi:hypothetical protein